MILRAVEKFTICVDQRKWWHLQSIPEGCTTDLPTIIIGSPTGL